MKIKEFIFSKLFQKILTVVAVTVVLVFVFSAGVFVGVQKVKYSYGWGENYYRNLIGPEYAMPGPFRGDNIFWDQNYITPHGIVGTIIQIGRDGVVLQDPDDMEIPVLVDRQTTIKGQRRDLVFSDLQVGNHIIVIGSPDNYGNIMAKFIRIDNKFIKN